MQGIVRQIDTNHTIYPNKVRHISLILCIECCYTSHSFSQWPAAQFNNNSHSLLRWDSSQCKSKTDSALRITMGDQWLTVCGDDGTKEQNIIKIEYAGVISYLGYITMTNCLTDGVCDDSISITRDPSLR